MWQYLKFLFSQFQSSKYMIQGKCKKCGKCCRSIVFEIKDGKWVETEKEFEILKNWDKKYNHFFISSKDEKGRLLFTCKSLGDDNKCKNYFFRSLYCRKYPLISNSMLAKGAKPHEGCGYYFELKKSFDEFLK